MIRTIFRNLLLSDTTASKSRNLKIETLEGRSLLAITPLQFSSGVLDPVIQRLDSAFEAGEDDVGGLSERIAFFENDLDSAFQFASQVSQALSTAKSFLAGANQANLQSALNSLSAATSGQFAVSTVGAFNSSDFTIDLRIKPATSSVSIPVSNDVTIPGINLHFTFNTASIPNVSFNAAVDAVLRLRVRETASGPNVEIIPGDGTNSISKLNFKPTLSIPPRVISGTVADVISYSGSLGFSFAPVLALKFGTSSSGTSISNMATLADGKLEAGTGNLVVPFVAKISTPFLPQAEYRTTFTLPINRPTSISRGGEQVLIAGLDVTNAGSEQFAVAVLNKAAGPLVDRVNDFVPKELSDLLLGETPAFGTYRVKDIIAAVDQAYAGALTAAGLTTPIDFIKLIPAFGQTPAALGAVKIAKTILGASELSKNLRKFSETKPPSTPKQKAEFASYLDEAKKLGFDFPMLTDPVDTVFKLLTKEPVDLVRWNMDMLVAAAEEYGLPVEPRETLGKRLNGYIQSIGLGDAISVSPSPTNPSINRFVVNFDSGKVFDIVLGSVNPALANGVKKAFDTLGLTKALTLRGRFAIQAGVSAGINSSFVTNGLSVRNLGESFYVGAKDLFDFEFAFDAEVNIPPLQANGFDLERGISLPSPKEAVKSIANGAAQAGEAITGAAERAGNWAKELAGGIAKASLSGGINGNFNLGLADPSGDGKLSASEAFDLIRAKQELCLVVAKGNVNAFGQASATLVGYSDSIKFNTQLLNFNTACIQVDGGGGSPVQRIPYAQLKNGVLTVFDDSSSNVIEIRNSVDGKTIEVLRGAAKINRDNKTVFSVDAVKSITVDLRGVRTADPAHTTFRSATGGNDRVTLSSNLKAVPVTVFAGKGDDVITAAGGSARFFRGNLTVFGGDGADFLSGGAGVNNLLGEGGTDTLVTGTGSSTLDGGTDNDVLRGLSSTSGVTSNFATHTFIGGTGNDTLNVGKLNKGSHRLVGGGLANIDAGQNLLIGGSGSDLLIAGNASPSFVPDLGSGSSSVLIGKEGNDTLYGTPEADLLVGGGIETRTYSGVDSLSSGDGDDFLFASNMQFDGSLRSLPTEFNQTLGFNKTELMNGGPGLDEFYLGNSNSTTNANGGLGVDKFLVSTMVESSAGTVDSILGPINIDAGIDSNNELIVNDRGGRGNDSVVISASQIRGLSPGNINFIGVFNTPTGKGGIKVFGSNTYTDTVLVNGLNAENSLTLSTGGGADVVSVGDNLGGNNGNLDSIQGRFDLDTGSGADSVYINDRGAILETNYLVTPSLVANELSENGIRRAFAGIRYVNTESVRLDGTDLKNAFIVRPSTTTTFHIDGNLPAPGTVCPEDGDYLKLDTKTTFPFDPTGRDTSGRKLSMTARGEGQWEFRKTTHKPVTFESIERFNHVDMIAVGNDVGSASNTKPVVHVYDAETSEMLFSLDDVQLYGASNNFGVRVAVADIDGDGIPDVITAPGRNTAPVVKVFSGRPQPGVLESLLYELAAAATFGVDFTNGVNVAAGDVTGDCMQDIILAPSRGAANVLVFENRVLSGGGLVKTKEFQVFSDLTGYIGGANIAAGDLDGVKNADGDTTDELIVSTGAGVNAEWRSFNLQASPVLLSRVVVSPAFQQGIAVSAGNLDGDLRKIDEVVVSYQSGGKSLVNVYGGVGSLISSFEAFPEVASVPNTAVRTTVRDWNDDGKEEVFAVQGQDSRSGYRVKKFNGLSGALVDEFFSSSGDDGFFGGGAHIG